MTNNNIINVAVEVGGKTISFETGLMAKQSDGAVVARLGDTMVLAAAVSDKNQKPGLQDFVPLTVNYKERTYAAGKIPGGFFKREARPSKKETLASRLIDRSMRPLFPEGYACETNITAMVLSFDSINDADVLSIAASSAATVISCIPFTQPVAGVRVNRVNGQFVINATLEERKLSDMDLVIAGTAGGIMMVEGGANEVDEETLVQAIALAHPEIKKLCAAQLELREKCGNRAKFEFNAEKLPQDVLDIANTKYRGQVSSLLHSFVDKQTRDVSIAKLKDAMKAEITEKYPEMGGDYADFAMEMLAYEESRNMVVNEGIRVDGRKTEEIRALSSIVGLLPNAHGSALFTRGQTQGLVVATLGTGDDAQLIEGLDESYDETFMLHYNFPGFSTGECKPDRSPGRREIGHGELARRALMPLLPSRDQFPYTIRVVSDIMESNGSSSMASVCGGSLSLFDAGVPMKGTCSGIAMGLITVGDKYAVISDIMGLEDHLGDMDFKLTGSRKGITAFQMDLKLATGISLDVLRQAIAQASRGRIHIMDHMESVLPTPRKNISKNAPVIYTMMIPVDKIGALIGPGGKNIKRITEASQSKIDVDDTGKVIIAAANDEKLQMARAEVELLTKDVELGQIYKGKVVSIQPFGAFVELLPGKDGLLHISEIDKKRVEKVEDVLSMGDMVDVKVVNIEDNGKIRLSRKILLK